MAQLERGSTHVLKEYPEEECRVYDVQWSDNCYRLECDCMYFQLKRPNVAHWCRHVKDCYIKQYDKPSPRDCYIEVTIFHDPDVRVTVWLTHDGGAADQILVRALVDTRNNSNRPVNGLNRPNETDEMPIIGYIGPSNGRGSLRQLIIEWLAEFSMPPPECKSPLHGSPQPVVINLNNKWQVADLAFRVLSSACLSCHKAWQEAVPQP